MFGKNNYRKEASMNILNESEEMLEYADVIHELVSLLCNEDLLLNQVEQLLASSSNHKQTETGLRLYYKRKTLILREFINTYSAGGTSERSRN